MALTAEQRLEKAAVAILNRPEFTALAGVYLIGTKRIADDIPTAYTDGVNEVYGRAFVEGITDAQLRFAMLHEGAHKQYMHLLTWHHYWLQSPQLANIAADFVVNHALMRTKAYEEGWIAPIPDMLYDPKYDEKWDVGMVYRDILKQLPPSGSGGSSGKGRGKGRGNGSAGGSGPHGTCTLDDLLKGGLSKTTPAESGAFDEHDWEKAQKMTAQERKKHAENIDRALRQGAILASKTGHGDALLDKTLLEPRRDWRDLLRDWISEQMGGGDYATWRRPARRYLAYDMAMPSAISERPGELVLAVDTSGSCCQPETVGAFLSNVKAICDQVKPAKVHLLYWDTGVAAHEIYEPHEYDSMLTSTAPKGGGGTMVECVTAYLGEKRIAPKGVVVLTDGYLGGGWGDWPCPVLWAVVNNPTVFPPIGVAVNLDVVDGEIR